jgi:hypothetical protein
VRNWTGDLQGWYSGRNAVPVFGGAGKAYVFLYGMMTACFLVLMLFRGATFHLWTLGSGQRMHAKMVHK